MKTKKRALIFCPCIDGHRQNYCYVIADLFVKKGFDVMLAAGRSPEGEKAEKTPLFNMPARTGQVEFYDLGNTEKSHLKRSRWVDTVRNLEHSYLPAWTFFPTGDEIVLSLRGLGKGPKPAGLKRAAVFIYINNFYKRDLSGITMLHKMRRYAINQYKKSHEAIYFSYLARRNLGLDAAFSTNEDFFSGTPPHYFNYLPEIYRSWGLYLSSESELIKKSCDAYRDFLRLNPGRRVLLYYGGWQARRGYDTLMKLALKDTGSVFVGCGRPTPDSRWRYNIDEMRKELSFQGRIFENVMSFVPENDLTSLLFGSCDFIILPYRSFYGISGSMIQATSYGKPVLTPDIGHLNSLVKKYGIGMTYRHDDFKDLTKCYEILKKRFNDYNERADSFSRGFSIENVEMAFRKGLGISYAEDKKGVPSNS